MLFLDSDSVTEISLKLNKLGATKIPRAAAETQAVSGLSLLMRDLSKLPDVPEPLLSLRECPAEKEALCLLVR